MCAAWRRSTLHRKRHLERVGIVHVQARVNVAMIDQRRRGSTLQGDEVDALLYCPMHRWLHTRGCILLAVSITHRTLPTILLV